MYRLFTSKDIIVYPDLEQCFHCLFGIFRVYFNIGSIDVVKKVAYVLLRFLYEPGIDRTSCRGVSILCTLAKPYQRGLPPFDIILEIFDRFLVSSVHGKKIFKNPSQFSVSNYHWLLFKVLSRLQRRFLFCFIFFPHFATTNLRIKGYSQQPIILELFFVSKALSLGVCFTFCICLCRGF